MSRIVNWDNPGPSFGFPLVGKIKIGEKGQTQRGATFPKALEYFKCYTDNPVIQAAFEKAIGQRSKLTIAFLSDDPGESCKQEYILLNSAGKKVGTGNGREFRIWDRPGKAWVAFRCYSKEEAQDLMKRFEVAYSVAETEKTKGYDAKWKPRLTLKFLIPELSQVMGTFRFETTAESTISGVVQTFDTIQNMAGTVIGIPFELAVTMHTAWNETGTRYPVVSMRCAMESDSVRLIHAGREKMFAALQSGGFRVFTPDEVKALAVSVSDAEEGKHTEELTEEQEAAYMEAKSAIESIHAGPDAVKALGEVYRAFPSLAKVQKFIDLCADAKARFTAG